jgi:hypothetical protein
MTNQTEFPRELLTQPPLARRAYFQDKVIAHPHLKEAHRTLLNAIQQPAGASLIFVFGPTGVGKTTLRLRLEQQLLQSAQAEAVQNPGRIPIAGLEAPAPERGDFKWKDYYTRALQALDEPLIAQKIDYGMRAIRRDGSGHLVIGRHAPLADLRWALEQALHHRRPGAFIVDEAQHLKKLASGRRLLDQMDIVKSLASLTDTIHVLIGTYELLGLADLSAQLNRRSREIHFSRYRADSARDMTGFQSVLLTFQRHLPLAQEPDLVSRSDYFYERSAGCVGVLKNWLTRALAMALEEGAKTLTARHLTEHAEPTRKLLRLAREIKEGEEAFQDKETQRSELRSLLAMPSEPAPAASTAKSVGRVGQRAPQRDQVGKDQAVV